ncbi:MAG TPA: NAD-dependent epimerase/dehydratase family protein [Myxococcales bacterium]|nr:NAD-dependent epimerase/dehydratase family protein [Myxococcales bacterium]
MKSALIGHTGFVGSNLRQAVQFDVLVNSSNVDELRGRRFGLVVCAGARAEKWKANRDPAADLAGIERLASVLREVRAERFVLVSTVDVFEAPAGLDESAPADARHAYGRHRRMLEQLCAERFDAQVLRLPGLFGPGLKKNALYDLLHENEVEKIHPQSTYQFYDVRALWDDAEKAHGAGIHLLHLATEPLAMGDIAARCFGRELRVPAGAPARYDVRSRHADLWGGRGGYLRSREEVLRGLERFVREERGQ